MGCCLSKESSPESNGVNDITTTGSSNKAMEYLNVFTNYEQECSQDPQLRSFDANLKNRTLAILHSSSSSSSSSGGALETFSKITGCLLDNNKEVVEIILNSKDDIKKSPELFDLVKDYFDYNLQTLSFCTSLQKSLLRANRFQEIIGEALSLFDQETDADKYTKTLAKLQQFRTAGEAFTQEFYLSLAAETDNQKKMLERLAERKAELDAKLGRIEGWRKVSCIIFVSAVAAVLICAVVTAALAAPPVAAAVAAAAAAPLGPMGKWIDSLWKEYSEAVERERGLVESMEFGGTFAYYGLKFISVDVEQLEIHVRYILRNADSVLEEEEKVKVEMEGIKKRLEVFTRSLEVLESEVNQCTSEIQRARTAVLERVRKFP